MGYELIECFEAIYFIPMPNSWSDKKKAKCNGMPCQVKPDIDNITKAFFDSLAVNDQHVWKENCEKRWAYSGSIIIYQ